MPKRLYAAGGLEPPGPCEPEAMPTTRTGPVWPTQPVYHVQVRGHAARSSAPPVRMTAAKRLMPIIRLWKEVAQDRRMVDR